MSGWGKKQDGLKFLCEKKGAVMGGLRREPSNPRVKVPKKKWKES